MKRNRWDLIGLIGSIIAVMIGVYAVIKSGGPGSIYIAIGMIVVFGSMGFFYYKFLLRPKFNSRRLQSIGIPGKAKIIEVRNTNITVNNNPEIKLMLEVKNNFGYTYTTTCRIIVSRLRPGLYQPGMEVPVKIDPKNEKNVIIDL
jgi:hypothetical protein